MGDHVTSSNLGSGLSWDAPTRTLSATGGATDLPVFSGRYLDNTSDSDGTASFIDADVNTNGAWTFSLRDADHAAGMHYHIRVDSGTALLTIQRASGSTKTISGQFVGQTFAAATSVAILRDDGILRLKPAGANWIIY